jgi:hypothetical protein
VYFVVIWYVSSCFGILYQVKSGNPDWSLSQALGEQLKLRQQVIATATVFFKRFYAINSLHTIDPLLLAPTAVFLARLTTEIVVGARRSMLKKGRIFSANLQPILCSKESFGWAL